MRNERAHKFLIWAGPSVLVFLASCLGLLIAAAQIWDGVKRWTEIAFSQWSATLTAPWFVALIVAGIFVYVWAIIHTGGPRNRSICVAGLVRAGDTPENGMTAVRLIVRNTGRERIEGLVAQLVGSEPPVASFPQSFQLPLTLATKTRLDMLRNNGGALPHHPFDLNAGAEKQVELCWLNAHGSLEGYITHEAGQAEFLVLDGYIFDVEISGESEPTRCKVRLFITDDTTGAWDCEIAN